MCWRPRCRRTCFRTYRTPIGSKGVPGACSVRGPRRTSSSACGLRDPKFRRTGRGDLCGLQDKERACVGRRNVCEWPLLGSRRGEWSRLIVGMTDAAAGAASGTVIGGFGPPTQTSELSAELARGLVGHRRSERHVGRTRADVSVVDIASRIAALSELGDQRLSDVFRVERETFCRWRNGVLANPRDSNRRRLGLVLRLFEDLASHQINVKDWMLNQTDPSGRTPYELLVAGGFEEVAYLASTAGIQPVTRDVRLAAPVEVEPLRFGDDDVWEPQDDGDE